MSARGDKRPSFFLTTVDRRHPRSRPPPSDGLSASGVVFGFFGPFSWIVLPADSPSLPATLGHLGEWRLRDESPIRVQRGIDFPTIRPRAGLVIAGLISLPSVLSLTPRFLDVTSDRYRERNLPFLQVEAVGRGHPDGVVSRPQRLHEPVSRATGPQGLSVGDRLGRHGRGPWLAEQIDGAEQGGRCYGCVS